jgi:hypothetical protein
MNWEAITKFITTIGLPAALAVVLLWFFITTIHNEISKAMERQLAIEKRIEECCCKPKQ